ncbi:MAG: NlpC/P60 family protein [Anaerosomatales bacterium]|nr:NlpC/P60 family protein [Anaerosomatales bacterium]MDT8433324.1 NlpC/P60 family protein [Anaerosomatales bacterium]
MLRASSTRAIGAILTGVLAFALLAGAVQPVFATPSTPEIEAKRQEVDAARSQLEDLADEAELRREELLAATEALESVRADIADTRDQLAAARAEQRAAENALAERAAGIYRSGSVQMLEVLMGTTSFGDFLTRMEWLRRVNRNDAVLVLSVKDAVAAVHSAERRLERRETELGTLKRQAEVKSREVDEAVARQERYVSTLDREIANLVAAEEERLRKEAEKRARKAAEEAARRAAAEQAAREAQARSNPSPGVPPAPGIVAQPNARAFDPARLGPGRPDAVVAGMNYLGVPYVWGGSTPQGFDCSGLTWYVYRELGISIPRNSRTQFTVGGYIPPDRFDLLLPGDLVFFGYDGNPDRIHHVGIYVGGGDYLHAPSTGRPVQVESLTSRIDRRGDFVGATRP